MVAAMSAKSLQAGLVVRNSAGVILRLERDAVPVTPTCTMLKVRVLGGNISQHAVGNTYALDIPSDMPFVRQRKRVRS